MAAFRAISIIQFIAHPVLPKSDHDLNSLLLGPGSMVLKFLVFPTHSAMIDQTAKGDESILVCIRWPGCSSKVLLRWMASISQHSHGICARLIKFDPSLIKLASSSTRVRSKLAQVRLKSTPSMSKLHSNCIAHFRYVSVYFWEIGDSEGILRVKT